MTSILKRALLALLLLAVAGQPIAAQAQDVVARGLAVQAKTAAKFRFKGTPSFCAVGDSLTGFANLDTSSPTVLKSTTASWWSWYRDAAQMRFYTDASLNLATPSTDTSYLVSTELPALLALIAAGKCDVVFDDDGTNDVGGATNTAAQMVANQTAFVSAVNAKGVPVVILSVLPQSGFSTAQRQQVAAANRGYWLLSQDITRNVQFIDLNPVFVDYSTGSAKTGYLFSDNVHFSPVGGNAIAQFLLTATDKILGPPGTALLAMSTADTYSATLNPRGSFLTSGMLSGTGGTLLNSATGTCAASTFCGYSSSTATTFTATYSKGTDATNATIPTQVITFGGTGDATAVFASVELSTSIPTTLVAGDKVYGACYVSWSGVAGLKGIYLRTTEIDNSVTVESYDLYEYAPGGTSFVIPASFSGILWTRAITIGAGLTAGTAVTPTSLRLRIGANPLTSGSVAGTAAISQCAFRKAGTGAVAGF